jgi:D-alanine-D-alanine ligase
MDKAVAKTLLAVAGLPVLPWIAFSRSEYEAGPDRLRARIAERLPLPQFVKPANGGSSVGITRVERSSELAAAIDHALDCDVKVIVEQGRDVREIECAVLGNDVAEASVVGEIFPAREFYDYESKYLDSSSRLEIPARLPAQISARIREQAVAVFRTLELRGFARVDFFVERSSSDVFVNEVNTLPGFTPISMFPKLWEASGLEYPRLIERLVDLALEHGVGESRRRTHWRQPG